MFKTHSAPCDGKTWVLAVEGAVDSSNATQLQEALESLFQKGIYRIILDLERVTFLASAGLACLLHARDVVLDHAGDLVLAGTHARIREIFDLLGIASFLRFAPDLGGARAQLEGKPA